MASDTLRSIPVPIDASQGVQTSFRLLAQNTNLQNQELSTVLSASGADTAALAPTNLPSSTTKTIIQNEDSSMDIVLTWAYTQGVVPAEFFVLFWKEGALPLSPLTVADNAVMVGLDARAFRFEGLNPLNNYRFGIAAGRRPTATSGAIVGTIVQPNSGGGSWADLTFGTPNYIGTIMGVEQHNWTLTAAGQQVGSAAVGFLDPPTNLISAIGLSRDGVHETWAYADEEYNGLTLPYGQSYNLLIHDLVAKLTVYAHCYDVFDFGASAATDADKFQYVFTGAGVVNAGQAGPFGNAVLTAAVDSANRAYWRTKASSAAYKTLRYAEIWFKRTGNPAAAGDILALSTTNGAAPAEYPMLRLNTDGTVTAIAWNGAAFVTVTSVATVTDGAWHWIKVRLTGAALSLRIDGATTVTTATAAVSFSTGAASNLFVLLGSGAVDLFGSINYYDELFLSDTDINRSLPTREASDLLASAAGAYYIWHFQEPVASYDFINARHSNEALVNLIAAYNTVVAGTGDSARYLFTIHGSREPQTNRLNAGLPEALASIGASRVLFSSAQFARQSAYALVGQPNIGEGNGLEYYAGTIDNDPLALCKVAFQTQGSKILALSGTGWQQNLVPGVPTNNPNTLANSESTSDTGERIHKLMWLYTQPALSGDNKLADGFILYYLASGTNTPLTATEQMIKIDIAARSFTFSWSLTAPSFVNYAIAAYRRTSSGIEVGPKITTANWQGRTASLYVQSLDPGVPTAIPTNLQDAESTSPTGQRINKLTWDYTQGTLPADGFVMNFEVGSITNPDENQYWLNKDARAYTFSWSLAASTLVSYSIAAYRRTINGVEIGAPQQVASWKGRTADLQIAMNGLQPTLTINPGAVGGQAVHVVNAGIITLDSVAGSPARIDFSDGSSVLASILGATSPSSTLEWRPASNGGLIFRLGDSSLRWSLLELEAISSILINSTNVGFIILDDVTLNHPFIETSCNGTTFYVGRSGNIEINPGTGDVLLGKALVALGGGAAPTFGTIGGTGPATAAQNTWARFKDSGGNAFWVPAWK